MNSYKFIARGGAIGTLKARDMASALRIARRTCKVVSLWQVA